MGQHESKYHDAIVITSDLKDNMLHKLEELENQVQQLIKIVWET